MYGLYLEYILHKAAGFSLFPTAALHAKPTSWQLQHTILLLLSCWLGLICGPKSGTALASLDTKSAMQPCACESMTHNRNESNETDSHVKIVDRFTAPTRLVEMP